MADNMNTEDRWLLTIIGSMPYVEGRTRLQKFGILASRKVLDGEEFFDDWRADSYGGFSKRMQTSLEKMKAYEYVQSYDIRIGRGYTVNRYVLTEKGREMIKDFVEEHSSKLSEVKSIVLPYFKQPLKLLLRDVYRLYPELTTNSKIKAGINNIDPSSSEGPEIPLHEKLDIPASQHVLGDMEFREYLARSIGLDRVPDLDPSAFDRIKGLWSKKIDAEHVDSVELVREIRGCA